MYRTVRAPDGGEWQIRRLWVQGHAPKTGMARWWWERLRGRGRVMDALDIGSDVGVFDDLATGGVVAVVAILLFVLVLLFFGVPLLLLAVEGLLFVLVVIGALMLRIVARRPWVLEVIAPSGQSSVRHVVGLREAREKLALAESAIRAGRQP